MLKPYIEFLCLGNIYRQLPSHKDQWNITIILHSDGAPVVNVNSKNHLKSNLTSSHSDYYDRIV